MMSFIFCFVVSMSFANALYSVTVGNHVVNTLKANSVQCYEETGDNDKIFQHIMQWEFGGDQISKKFFYCLFKNTGYYNEVGHFNGEKFLALFDKTDKKEIAKNSVIECNKINASDPVETAYKVILCFAEKSSLKLVSSVQ